MLPVVPRFIRAILRLLPFIAVVALGAESRPPNPRLTGLPFLRVWQPEDYGGAPGNANIVQDPLRGFIYVANGGGILEYDGTRWRLLRVPGGSVHTIAQDGRGRIWFVTDNQIGWLAPDEHGELRAVSALSGLPAGEPPIFPMGAATSAPDGIYLVNRDRVFFFGDDEAPARIWRPNDGELFASQLWWMDGELAVRSAAGVRRLQRGEFRLIEGLKTFAFAVRPDPAGGTQLLSRDGIRRWDHGYRPVAPGLAALTSPLEGDLALNAIYLSDGRMAWGTTRSGVVVSDAAGRRLQVISREDGLPSNRIEGLCEDRQGGLWVASRNGLARLQVDSPYARHGVAELIDSTPHALAVHHGDLYVGGGEGLSRRDALGNFHTVRDLSYLMRSLVSHGDELFVTGLELRTVSSDDRSQLLGTQYFHLVPLRSAPGVFVSGSPTGVRLTHRAGTGWEPLGQTTAPRGATTVLLEWPAGVVWVANHTTGLGRIDFRGGPRIDAPVKNFGPAEGLPVGVNQYNIGLLPFAGGLEAMVRGQLLRLDDTGQRFIAETRIAGLTGPKGRPIAIAGGSSGSDETNFWLQVAGPRFTIYRIQPDGPNHWRAELPPEIPIRAQRATALLEDPAAHTLWIGQAGALISRDLDWRPARPPAPFQTFIRRIETEAGAVLWADGKPPVMLSLPAAQNALRIFFAAPSFTADQLGRARLRYRTRLRGLDSAWSRWSSDTRRDFTNLPYRDLTFDVQAADDSGRLSTVASCRFSIAPPWWLTLGAFAGYGVLGLGAIAGAFALRTRTLRRRNQALETTVAERTQELHLQNRELARLHRLELDEKISAQLAEEKARLEVLRYQLNPHFLFNALNSVCAQIIREPISARGMVVRLADFCRLTLHREDEEEAMTIDQEMKLLRAYLEIEQARLGDLMHITIETDPEIGRDRIPPFLLLPLVENAVKYGAATSHDRVSIRLVVRRSDPGIMFEIANTGQWLTAGSHDLASHGIGLENLRQRLARYYPQAHEFTTSAADGWVMVRLRLLAPLREHSHAHH